MAACTLDVLTQESKCWAVLDPKQKQATLIYMLAKTLATLGGTDYSSTLSTTLMSDACPFRNLTPGQQEDFLISIAEETAEGTYTLDDISPYTKCLYNADPNALDAATLWLLCSIKNAMIA